MSQFSSLATTATPLDRRMASISRICSAVGLSCPCLNLNGKKETVNAGYDVGHTATAKAVRCGEEVINSFLLQHLDDFIFDFFSGVDAMLFAPSYERFIPLGVVRQYKSF